MLMSACASLPGGAGGEQITLAREGETDYTIIIALEAAPEVEEAASELSYFLGEITGAEFEVKRDDAAATPFEVVLGETNRKRLADVPAQQHPTAWEGFLILPEADRLYIMGGSIARGTLYGVYDFLERDLGVRFLAPEVNHVPRRTTLALRLAPRTFNPLFEYRAHYTPNDPRPGYARWGQRSRVNSWGVSTGSVRRLGHPVHTFGSLVPAGRYFDEHPEYFALVNGKRTASTLCLTHPGTLAAVLETARGWAESATKDPGTKNIIQISQNDSGAYCACVNCAAADAEEGAPMTGALVRFLNAAAKELEKDHPDIWIETLAYMTSEVPPKKTKVHPNVIIWMAPIMKDSSRPITAPQVNYSRDLGDMSQHTHMIPKERWIRKTYENLLGWGRVAENIYIWDYPQSFHDFLVPYPSLWANAENIRIFAENGVTGYFPQQPNTDGSEMRYLRNHMISRLQWRPDLDAREVVKEFCLLYYGSGAGAAILEYIDLLHASFLESDRPLWWGGYKDDVVLPELAGIMERSAALAETQEQRDRVAEFRLPIWRLQLTKAFGEVGKVRSLTDRWRYQAEDAGVEGSLPPDNFTGWQEVEIPTCLWTQKGGHGAGWYATEFELASPLSRGALHFLAMEGVWDVYLDGDKVGEALPSGLGDYREVPYLPLNRTLEAGKHTLVVRVSEGSGFYRSRHHENTQFGVNDAVTLVDLSVPLSPKVRTAAEGFLKVSRRAGVARMYYGYSKPDPYLNQVLWPKVQFLLTHGG